MHYAASKGGMVALTRSIARGFGSENVLANVVAFLASGAARHATGATIDINGASYVR